MGSRQLSNNKSRGRKPNAKKPAGKKKDMAETVALFDRFSGMHQRTFRRLANAVTVGTNGAGVIPLSLLASSANVNGYPDFTSASNLYTLYRVHAFKLTFWPVLKVNTTAVNAPAYVVTAPFRAGLAPTTIQQLQESPDSVSMSGYDKCLATVNWKGDPDAHLWTATNSAIASAEAFGMAIAGSSVLATSSTNTWYVYIEALVEFSMTG